MKQFSVFALAALTVTGAVALSSCGGGGSGSRPRATATPGPTAIPTTTATPGTTATPVPPISALRGQIAFVSTRDGSSDIYLMDFQGSNQRPLSAINTSSEERQPSVSRDGSRIVWSSNRPTSTATTNFEIYTANADGSNILRYTSDSGQFPPSDTQPVISPDGTRIAWRTTRGGNLNIAVMDITGDNQSVLTLDNSGADSDPAWTSDSQSILFYSERATGNGIYIMGANGSNPRPLSGLTVSSGSTGYFAPRAALNGQLLAVDANGPNSSTILLRNLDGSAASTTFSPGSGFARRFNASFSPDSTRLIYTASNGTNDEQIQTSALDGSGERALTSAGRNFEAMFSN